MSTLDTIVKDYDKNIMLRDCQRQAFEYLHEKKGDLLVRLPCNLPYRVVGPCRLSISVNVSKVVPKHVIITDRQSNRQAI
jgi:hypothetical protein